MHSRRALLYMPGDNWKMSTKSLTLDVDSICMDMEDGAAVNKKAEARSTIVKALQEYKGGNRSHPTMRAIAAGLTDQDMADLAAYYATNDGKVAAK